MLTFSQIAAHFEVRVWQVQRLHSCARLPIATRIGTSNFFEQTDLPAIRQALTDAGYLSHAPLSQPATIDEPDYTPARLQPVAVTTGVFDLLPLDGDLNATAPKTAAAPVRPADRSWGVWVEDENGNRGGWVVCHERMPKASAEQIATEYNAVYPGMRYRAMQFEVPAQNSDLDRPFRVPDRPLPVAKPKKPASPPKPKDDIDDMIARINGEGGFTMVKRPRPVRIIVVRPIKDSAKARILGLVQDSGREFRLRAACAIRHDRLAFRRMEEAKYQLESRDKKRTDKPVIQFVEQRSWEAGDLRDKIELLLKTIPLRESKVIRLRFGLHENRHDCTTYSLEDCGRIMNVTGSRIRQIQVRAIRKFRHEVRFAELEQYQDMR